MRHRAVCDTNTVLSALLFQQGRVAWLRRAWCSGIVVPLVCRETVAELLRVLAYPKFGLGRSEIDELLGDYLPYAEVVELSPDEWPACRDENDRVFLALAKQAGADILVTGDSDLLALADAFSVEILTPAGFEQRLGFGT